MKGQRDSRKSSLWIEVWAFAAVAIIAFVAGLLIGDLGSSPTKETVYLSTSSGETEEAAVAEPSGETTEPAAAKATDSPGGQIFASASCGTCHTLAAAGSTGETGPNLNQFLAPDDTTAGVEEMIVDPNAELAEGYPPNVMPQDYGQTLSQTEVRELAEYLVASTPAKP